MDRLAWGLGRGWSPTRDQGSLGQSLGVCRWTCPARALGLALRTGNRKRHLACLCVLTAAMSTRTRTAASCVLGSRAPLSGHVLGTLEAGRVGFDVCLHLGQEPSPPALAALAAPWPMFLATPEGRGAAVGPVLFWAWSVVGLCMPVCTPGRGQRWQLWSVGWAEETPKCQVLAGSPSPERPVLGAGELGTEAMGRPRGGPQELLEGFAALTFLLAGTGRAYVHSLV